MPKFIVRMECLVEIIVEAESIDDVKNRVCDLNNDELSCMPKNITEIYDVFEVEQIG